MTLSEDGYDDGDEGDWDDTRGGDAGWRVAAPFFLAALVIWAIAVAVNVAQFRSNSSGSDQQASFTRQITLTTIVQISFSLGGFVFAAGLLVLVLRQHERWRQGRYAPSSVREDAPVASSSDPEPPVAAPVLPYAANNWDDPSPR